jgi:hypothetical protein
MSDADDQRVLRPSRRAMKHYIPALATVLAACVAHSPSAEQGPGEGLPSRMRTSFEFILIVSEENRFHTPEDRAVLREMQRREGLRVCEEGEHGTTWKEDCVYCTCVYGRRSCPPVVCTHNSKVRETGWWPAKNAESVVGTDGVPNSARTVEP